MGEVADFLVQNDESFRRARLPALYSDFRSQRTLNPDGFEANIGAWRKALARAAWEGQIATGTTHAHHLVIPVNEGLLRSLEHKQFGRPLALGTVVRAAVAEKDLLPLQDFLRAKESIYQRPWTDLPMNIVSWVIGQVWSADGAKGEDRLPGGQFVVTKNVEAVTKSLADYAASTTSLFDRVFSKTHFYRTFSDSLVKGKTLSETDVEVLLRFASRDKGLVAYDGKTVKLHHGAKDKADVTEEDAAISSLKELIEDLKRQTTLMGARVEELAAKAKEAVARSNRIAALAALKSKKLTEISLETRYATLSQLEQVAAKIEQAADNVQLIKVMEGSSGVLRSLNRQVGGAEKVEEVMDNLREQMGEVDEVGNIIANAGTEAIVVDEAEIDDELAEMELQEKRKMEEVNEAERKAREEQEAAATAARLERIPAIQSESTNQNAGRETPTKQVTEGVRRLSLEDRQRQEPQLIT